MTRLVQIKDKFLTPMFKLERVGENITADYGWE